MPRWTPEARLRQAEAIRDWLPWRKSTGPRTAEGKARSAQNAWKGGLRPLALGWAQMLRQMEAFRRTVISSFCQKRNLGRSRPKKPVSSRKKASGSCFGAFLEPMSGLLGAQAPPPDPVESINWSDLKDLERLSDIPLPSELGDISSMLAGMDDEFASLCQFLPAFS